MSSSFGVVRYTGLELRKLLYWGGGSVDDVTPLPAWGRFSEELDRLIDLINLRLEPYFSWLENWSVYLPKIK